MTDPKEGLDQGDINRVAIEQGVHALKDTDEHGFQGEGGVEGVDARDVAEIAGSMAVAEALETDPPQIFGDDDTDLFRRTQLGEI